MNEKQTFNRVAVIAQSPLCSIFLNPKLKLSND